MTTMPIRKFRAVKKEDPRYPGIVALESPVLEDDEARKKDLARWGLLQKIYDYPGP